MPIVLASRLAHVLLRVAGLCCSATVDPERGRRGDGGPDAPVASLVLAGRASSIRTNSSPVRKQPGAVSV